MVIKDYFNTRMMELSDFEPDHALVNDPGVIEPARAPKLMRRGYDEFLIYHLTPPPMIALPARMSPGLRIWPWT
jgi:hypothetical protein